MHYVSRTVKSNEFSKTSILKFKMVSLHLASIDSLPLQALYMRHAAPSHKLAAFHIILHCFIKCYKFKLY